MADSYQAKWRHFHPRDRVWVYNPLSFDMVYRVADDDNQPLEVTLPSRKTRELPGGSIATLGVKRIVDEMIQQEGEALQMHDPLTRKKYEDKVIVREKLATVQAPVTDEGVRKLELPATEDEVEEKEVKVVEKEEEAFPGTVSTFTNKTAPKVKAS